MFNTKQYHKPKLVRDAVRELQGVSKALIYDGVLTIEEVAYLTEWVQKHDEYLTDYPFIELKSLLKEILIDGVVTDQERKQLYEFLVSITNRLQDAPEQHSIFNEVEQIEFFGKSFLFTGEMLFGDRNSAMKIVQALGGIPLKSYKKECNYLVVGDMGSEAYAYGNFGTKVKKAIEDKSSGKSNVLIIRERDFTRSILIK